MEVNGLNNTKATTSPVAKVSNSNSSSNNNQASVVSQESSQPQAVESVAHLANEPTKDINMTTGEQNGGGVRSHVREAVNEEIEKQFKELVDEINSRMQSHTEISYSMHSRSSKLNIKIIDKESKKVIKEWPSEKSLDLLAKIFEEQAVMLDKKL